VTELSKITEATKVLVIAGELDEATHLAGRNICGLTLKRALDVNAEHLLNCQKVILTNGATEVLAQRTA
jgi:ribosomal protein L4